MSTHKNADLHSALKNYDNALWDYQQAAMSIERKATDAQIMGRQSIVYLNQQVFNSAVRATCVVRATADAQLMDLDLGAGTQYLDKAAVAATMNVLQTRLDAMKAALKTLEEARRVLDERMAAVMATGYTALETLRGRLDEARKAEKAAEPPFTGPRHLPLERPGYGPFGHRL
jgi:hypothetical protein